MSKHRDRTWVVVIVLGLGLVIAVGLGLFAYIVVTATPLHPDPRDVPSVTRSAPPPQLGRRGRAGAADRPRRRGRAEPAGTVGGGRRRGRHRLGRRLRLGGPREAGARRAGDAVPDRHRVHRAHVRRGRPAAGERPPEARRRDPGVRAGVPEEAVARDAPAGDGAPRRHPERRRRRRAAVLAALRTAGRRAAALRASNRSGSSRAPSTAIRATAGSW